MKTTVKKLSDTKVSLTIAVDAQELNAAEQVALSKLAKNIKVPGFRKGKVPASVAAKHVDPTTLSQQTIDDALSKAVAEAFTTEKIQALDRPEVEVKKFVPGETLEFIAEVEILPQVKLGDYKKLTAKKIIAKVAKKDIDEILGRMQKGMSEKAPVRRAAKNGDQVTIDFIGKKDDVAFPGGTAEKFDLELGSNSFIPGFEEALVGMKIGEERSIPLEFPKDYHAAELAGAQVVFDVKLHGVTEQQMPKLDDEFAQKAGPFKTIDELKADIERELSTQKEREADEKLKDELVAELIKKSTVPVPEILKKDQAASIERDMTQNLMYQGLSIEQFLANKKMTREEWIEKEVMTVAEKRVQAGLVLAELSKVEKIEATSDELAANLNQYHTQYGKDKDISKQLQSPEVQRDLANRLITEKTVDRLLELNSK